MILEHVFNFFDRFPHDNTSFLVDLESHLIIPKIECSCGFSLLFCLFLGRNNDCFMGAKLQLYCIIAENEDLLYAIDVT